MNIGLHRLLVLITVLVAGVLQAQNPGDTIVVQTLDYNATTRDTMVVFPDIEGITYSKVLMQYNMRCHDANVNTTGGNGIACGEWDYSCNTYLHDPERIDSVNATTPSHIISGFSGSSFSYSSMPTYTVFQTNQETATVNNVISETEYLLGTDDFSNEASFPTSVNNAKSQFLYTNSELVNAGVQTGEINALSVYVASGSTSTDFLRIRMKSTPIALDASGPELTGWTQVYFANTDFNPGQNIIHFTNAFDWDGATNIAIELSYSNSVVQENLHLDAGISSNNTNLVVSNDNHLIFNSNNYIELDDYKGIGGANSRTIEAWIKTDVIDKEIVSWGTNGTGEKWVFRVAGGGKLRLEIAGAGVEASTNVADGEWHHVACVFQGTTLSGVDFYVDGDLENLTTTSSAAVNTNNQDGINVRVSRGVNNRYFEGNIDEVRIWESALSGATLSDWMSRKLTSDHPNISTLEVHYKFDEGTGTIITNGLGNQTATVYNGVIWEKKKGINLFKDFSSVGIRPKLGFIQGEYDLAINTTVVNDTLFNLPNPVTEFEIVSNYNSLLADEIVPIDYFNYWEATQNVVLNPEGIEISSTPVEPEGTITITDLPYTVRSASKIELMSFVTPYGIQLDLGPAGRTFTFDMTDYTPVFNGTKRLTMERGGQWQEEFDISFLFIVGTPPRDVIDMKQIWRVDYPSYAAISNDTYFEPREVPTLATGNKFKVRSSITGHGQEGEFIPRIHYLDVDGGSNEFSWQVWTECADNPIYPQGGAWIYDRAGWCPGGATDVRESDITQYVTPGETINLDYGINTATGNSNYIVSHQLITYGEPNFTLDAHLVEVERPSNRVEFSRQGPVCSGPTVIIQNTGSETLTSATINYWINDSSEPQSYEWTGSLEMTEQEAVILPGPDDLWSTVNPSNNYFYAEVLNPNGQTDQNPLNNTYKSAFNIPPVVPSNFIIIFRTNNFASENSYEIKDAEGNTVFSRSNMSNNTVYNDTLMLGTGCYTYFVYDNDDDGINFWANNDGGGYTRFKQVGGPTLQFFEGDFGDDIQFPFTIDYPLAFEDIEENTGFEVYPNPTKDVINIEISGFDNEVDILIYNSLGQRVYSQRVKSANSDYRQSIDFSQFESGVYVIRINDGTKTATQRFVKE